MLGLLWRLGMVMLGGLLPAGRKRGGFCGFVAFRGRKPGIKGAGVSSGGVVFPLFRNFFLFGNI